MVEPQPTKIPEWNRTGGNRTEPPEATPAPSKDTGWAINDQPPSSYFNWLSYYTGAWLKWLNERVFKGSGEHDLTISALQPDSTGNGGDVIIGAGQPNTTGNGGKVDLRGGSGGSIGNGGNIEMTSGASVNNNGGDIAITANNGGTRGGNITIDAGNATSSGPGGTMAIVSGDGANGSGGSVNFNSGRGNGTDQRPGTISIDTGFSTGAIGGRINMRIAESETGGSGSGTYTNSNGLYLRLDGDTGKRSIEASRYLDCENAVGVDPARGVLRIREKEQPTSPPKGDVYLDDDTDQLAVHNGTRYHNLNPTVYSNSDQAYKGIANTTTANRYYGFEAATYGGTLQNVPLRYTIPANALRVGSIIRVRTTIEFISGTGDPPNPCVLLGNVLTGTGPYLVGTKPLSAPDVACFEQASTSLALGVYAIECDIRVRVIGASGRLDYGGWGFNSLSAARAGVVETLGDTSNYPTNGNLDVYPAIFTNASTNTVAECLKFIVDVL